nr:G protein-regulated inducer of neurite outgrowth 1 [Misgurnus anguillicaudatus]
MEGPVLTESEVWKVGSGTSTTINTSDRSIDFSPLMNDSMPDEVPESPETPVQEEIEAHTDSEVTPDQIKSIISHELRLEEDLSSTQPAVSSDEPSEPSDTSLTPDQPDLNKEVNQEITILVTSHDCIFEDDENEDFEEQKISFIDGRGSVEEEREGGSIVVTNVIEVSQVQITNVTRNISTEENIIVDEPKLPRDQEENKEKTREGSDETESEKGQHEHKQSTDSSDAQNMDASKTRNAEPRPSIEVCGVKDQTTQPEGEEVNIKLKKTESTESKDGSRLPQDTLSLTRSPGRKQHVQTQVSLEVMYQSVATSPMTPQEGTSAFLFPSSFGKLATKCSTEKALTIETKDVEMQVGMQVESRSVATAPMTPIILTAPEVIPEPEPRLGTTAEETVEPLQEVSWDEKGMTWEVYGAVVEVAVLGTAIQKHLEKQVKKQIKQPSMLTVTDAPQTDLTETPIPVPSSPPPVSDPGECSLVAEQSTTVEEKEVKKGRRRQNPFRKWCRNVRLPSCCSRPRQDEEN